MTMKCNICGVESKGDFFCLACHLIEEHGWDSERFNMDDHIMMSESKMNNKLI